MSEENVRKMSNNAFKLYYAKSVAGDPNNHFYPQDINDKINQARDQEKNEIEVVMKETHYILYLSEHIQKRKDDPKRCRRIGCITDFPLEPTYCTRLRKKWQYKIQFYIDENTKSLYIKEENENHIQVYKNQYYTISQLKTKRKHHPFAVSINILDDEQSILKKYKVDLLFQDIHERFLDIGNQVEPESDSDSI